MTPPSRKGCPPGQLGPRLSRSMPGGGVFAAKVSWAPACVSKARAIRSRDHNARRRNSSQPKPGSAQRPLLSLAIAQLQNPTACPPPPSEVIILCLVCIVIFFIFSYFFNIIFYFNIFNPLPSCIHPCCLPPPRCRAARQGRFPRGPCLGQ